MAHSFDASPPENIRHCSERLQFEDSFETLLSPPPAAPAPYHVADVAALVDGVGDDDAVFVAGQFQPESRFGLLSLLLPRQLSSCFHVV